ncbi:tRNA1(Val) (adenine(37)-N6)-methyltransferase [Dellaglioa sp. P0083]|uniref:tRNA1(Val) (adenine(37)-N6)-methyltransferase n=1 Tax=Dellaglioa kimchii TaxID=3344667 RepID=UPI0038D482A3
MVSLNNNERIDQLYSNQIKIIQSSDVFSFSLDAVLLAHFADVSRKESTKIVDLCAGNGAVGLFVSQKTKGQIYQIELQEKLADMANRSIELNHLENQVQVKQTDLINTFDYLEKDSIDTVLCNPPYFPNTPQSSQNPNKYLAIARHEITTNLDSILEITSGLLKMKGKTFFVHRPDRLPEILSKMVNHRLAPKKIQFVHPKEGKEANMVLIEAIKDGNAAGIRIMPPIVVYGNDDEYTQMVQEIVYGR